MNATEQLQYEASTRMRYAVIAFIAALLLVGQQLIQLSGPHTSVDELTLDLITAHKRFPIDLIGAIVNAFGLVALIAMLAWLHRLARARSQDIREWVRWLVIAGGTLSALMAIAYAIVIAIKANQFVASGNQGYPRANALTSGGLIAALPLVAQLGSLVLAGGFIWTSLNGLRVGLLTKPLGYTGVAAGALVLFPLGAFVSFIQGFWLVGLSVLFAGRWMNGTPPAWETGTAVPWPSSAQARGGGRAAPPPRQRRTRRAELEAQAARGNAKGRGKAPEPAPASAGSAAGGGDAARNRASTPKRKRKRRS